MTDLAITRVSNACVLLDLGGEHVLTDPWFHPGGGVVGWMFLERPGLAPADLPRLAAIVGCHQVLDHWDVARLADHPYKETPVLCATSRMARAARRAGFHRVELLAWGERRGVSPALTVEVVPAHESFGMKVNSYVLEAPGLRVFFGGEARDLGPVRAYARTHPPVDVVLAPVNGVHLLGRKLVADARTAVELARILGARMLIPIHYAQRALPPLVWTTSGATDAARAAVATGVRVEIIPPGRRTMVALAET